MKWSTNRNPLLFYRIIRVVFVWFIVALAVAYLVTELTGASDRFRQVLTAVLCLPAIGVYLYRLFLSRGFFKTSDEEMEEWVKKHWPPPED